MTTAHNPFRPGFGESPTVWAGRTPIIDAYRTSLEVSSGSVGRMILISGARGIGKTTLVNELEDIATSNGWILLRTASHRDMIDELVHTAIPQAINRLKGRPPGRITGASVAGIGSITTTPNAELPVTPTLPSQLRALGELVLPHDTGIQITVDEIQAADPHQISVLATAIQDLVRDNIPVSFIGAGLTHGIQALLEHDGTTFLRRSQRYQLAPLRPSDSTNLLVQTALGSGHEFEPYAAGEAAAASHGYPYLLQLIGSIAWGYSRADDSPTIDVDHVQRAAEDAIPMLGNQVHQPELAALPQSQLTFLDAMATAMADSPTAHIGDIAGVLGRPVTSLSKARAGLIERDVIYAPARGQLAFRLPYLREFLDTPGGPLEVS